MFLKISAAATLVISIALGSTAPLGANAAVTSITALPFRNSAPLFTACELEEEVSHPAGARHLNALSGAVYAVYEAGAAAFS